MKKKTDKTNIPLNHTDFHILVSLADEERHGYGIMREVQDRTDGSIRLGPGTLYGAIKRLIDLRYIEESDQRPDPDKDDERRRCYFRLTGLGRDVAVLEVERLSLVVKQAQAKRLIGLRTLKPEEAS
jgi:DNA-binding PadR family transcriptional regulator